MLNTDLSVYILVMLPSCVSEFTPSEQPSLKLPLIKDLNNPNAGPTNDLNYNYANRNVYTNVL